MTEFLGDWTFSSQLPMVQLFGGAPHLAREYTFDLLTICFDLVYFFLFAIALSALFGSG